MKRSASPKLPEALAQKAAWRHCEHHSNSRRHAHFRLLLPSFLPPTPTNVGRTMLMCSQQRVDTDCELRFVSKILRRKHRKITLRRWPAAPRGAGDRSAGPILGGQHTTQLRVAVDVHLATEPGRDRTADRPHELSNVLPQHEVIALRPVSAYPNDRPDTLEANQDAPAPAQQAKRSGAERTSCHLQQLVGEEVVLVVRDHKLASLAEDDLCEAPLCLGAVSRTGPAAKEICSHRHAVVGLHAAERALHRPAWATARHRPVPSDRLESGLRAERAQGVGLWQHDHVHAMLRRNSQRGVEDRQVALRLRALVARCARSVAKLRRVVAREHSDAYRWWRRLRCCGEQPPTTTGQSDGHETQQHVIHEVRGPRVGASVGLPLAGCVLCQRSMTSRE